MIRPPPCSRGSRLTVRVERWPLARPFAIARGIKTEAVVVVAVVTDGDVCGAGEAVPYPRYGETPEGVAAELRAMADVIAGGIDPAGLQTRMPAGAARNALDCALWSLAAARGGRSLSDLLVVPVPAGPVTTAETIGLDSADAMARAALALADRPLLKLKLDGGAVVEKATAVRAAAPAARLIIDANEGWSPATLRAVAAPLAALGVEVIEQPLPAGEDDALAGLSLPVAVCADEACHTEADLPRLRGRYTMVNVKLDKAGGLTGALALIRAARDTGLGVMLGCMVSTSLAIRPALTLAPLADLVDLDGPLWLAGDREPRCLFRAGRVWPPEQSHGGRVDL